MAKCTYKLDKNKEKNLLETKITDTVNAFSAYTHEVEKSLLTINRKILSRRLFGGELLPCIVARKIFLNNFADDKDGADNNEFIRMQR